MDLQYPSHTACLSLLWLCVGWHIQDKGTSILFAPPYHFSVYYKLDVVIEYTLVIDLDRVQRRRYPLVSWEVCDGPVKEGHVKLVDGLGVRDGEGAGRPTVETSVK